MKPTSYLPADYQTITPYLIVKGGDAAIEFYKKSFNGREVMRMQTPNNTISHAEMMIGDSKFMLADECPEMEAKSPKSSGAGLSLYLYVPDVDATVAQAIKLGAKLIHEVKDQFYGDRNGTIEDPFGYRWSIATHIEDLTAEEVKQRAELT